MDYIHDDLRDGLRAAHLRQARRKSRLRVHVGDNIYPVLRLWPDGFALDAEEVTQLRGLVDLHDGARHLRRCLIVASVAEGGELICDYKSSTAAADRPPRDFPYDENAPAGYLPSY